MKQKTKSTLSTIFWWVLLGGAVVMLWWGMLYRCAFDSEPPMETIPIRASSEIIHISVRAGTSTIPKDMPVYLTGYKSACGFYIVEPADAGDPSKMPAIAITTVPTTTYVAEYAIVSGEIPDMVADTIPAVGMDTLQYLYVADGGGLTIHRLCGDDTQVQRMVILRRDKDNRVISVEAFGIGRRFDIPAENSND